MCNMNVTKSLLNHSQLYHPTKDRRVSGRNRIKSTRYSGEEYNCDDFETNHNLSDVTQIKIEDEKFTWDFFYTYNNESNYPFSGFDTKLTVKMILMALTKIRRKRTHLISQHDVILEVGHGKFPLLWDLRENFKNFLYFGVEFSTVAFEEALKQRYNGTFSSEGFSDNSVEFLTTKSLHYFNPDGTTNLDLIYPPNTMKSGLSPGRVTIVLGKSFLDYLSCSVSVSNWNLEPRIPQGVVDMFDSICIALKKCKVYEELPVFILVEPDDMVKFKDHVGIITKVIYTSTFVKESPSKNLRLIYTYRNKNEKAICYGLVKVNSVYQSYDELRSDIYKVVKNLYSTKETTDEDWLLPHDVPPKWLSNDTKDFDNLTIL